MAIKRMLCMVFGLSLAVIGLAVPATAQNPTLLSLQIDNPQVQTGQEYVVTIQVDNVPELWMASMEIAFDPSRIYIMGTQAGSPVSPGSLWTAGSSLSILNRVENDQIAFTVSQLAPADLLAGSGVIGTFRIYPLAAGTTQLTFRRADLTTMTFSGEGAQRTGSDPRSVPFTPALLELTITGATVEQPAEPTATPQPTETPTAVFIPTQPAQPPTLANVTLAPTTPTAPLLPPPAAEEAEDEGPDMLLLGLAALVAVSGVVVLVVLYRYDRSRHRSGH